MTLHLTPVEILAALGGLLALVLVWRASSRAARRAAETARQSARLMSLAGRVIGTTAVIVGVQWIVIIQPDNTWPLLGPPTPSGADTVESVRKQVDRLCWTGILLGLAFTMTNVQQFAAAGAPAWSLVWLAAWLLDPMVSLVLLAILRAEQVTARYGVHTGGWVRAAKWFTLAATYVMNTWEAFVKGSADMVVLHSVPPLVVFVAAEAVTDLRDKLAEASAAAFMNTPPSETRQVPRSPSKPRTSFDEYLSQARHAWQPGVTVTPAWIREVTGCSRGLSSRLATVLAADLSNSEGQS